MRELCSVIQRSDVIGASHGASVDMEEKQKERVARTRRSGPSGNEYQRYLTTL